MILFGANQPQNRWDLAVREWERVLRSKGEVLQDGYPPDLVNAQLQLARAYRVMRNRKLAESHYEEVVRMEQHADGFPLIEDAKRELRELSLQGLPQ